MPELDLIIRGATLVTPDGEVRADLAIAVETIAAVGDAGTAREEIDARGLHVFPGVIDSHVHFNDPGRAEWEGIDSGSRALAAGGGTMFFDMPLNAHPPTCDTRSFDEKLIVAEEKSVTDFALWGGLVPGNFDKLEQLARRGVIGFKAFMSNSGIEDFECVDNATLKAGMKICAQLGKLVAVHAESDAITSKLAVAALAKDNFSARDYLNSRPIHAELEAIHRAIEMSRETKCALHIVHVSSGAGVALVASAQSQGVDVTAETCPHYLALTEDDVIKIGALAKCAPPLRPKSAQDVLWRYLENGFVKTIGSDHSPSPPDMKGNYNFFKVWGGISGVQHSLPLMLTEGRVNRGIATSVIANLLSANVAERFKIPQKGKIAVGLDADLTLVDLKQTFAVAKEDLLYRHQQSPYVGRALTGRVIRTILRGRTIFKDGKITASGGGKLITPSK